LDVFLQENVLFTTLICGSVFSHYVVFHEEISFILSSTISTIRVLTLPGICDSWFQFSIYFNYCSYVCI